MKGRTWWMVLGLTAGLLLGGCGGSEPEPEPQPELSETEAAAEQESARRQQATVAVEQRTMSLTDDVTELLGGASGLTGELQQSLEALRGQSADAERLLAALKQSGTEGWEQALAGLESTLSGLRSAQETVSKAISEWRAREQAVLAQRESEGLPIDSKTGLIAGLDGGEYSHYKDEVVERIKGQLRGMGLYAGPLDDVFDRAMLDAVGRFQKSVGLGVSGVPSPLTRARLSDLGSGA